MNPICKILALAAVTFAMPVHASSVDVVFVNPEQYTDATPTDYPAAVRTRDLALAGLRKHLELLGAKYLNDSDHLSVEVLDVDLAGMLEPRRRGYVRILRESTPPVLHLRYTLVRAGVESRGDDRVSDIQYLQYRGVCSSAGILCYETRLLDDWFLRSVLKNDSQKSAKATVVQ